MYDTKRIVLIHFSTLVHKYTVALVGHYCSTLPLLFYTPTLYLNTEAGLPPVWLISWPCRRGFVSSVSPGRRGFLQGLDGGVPEDIEVSLK